MTTTQTFIVWEDTTPKLMARVVADDDGLVIVQADVSTISKLVTLESTGAVVVASAALTVSAVVFNALQTDARWTIDTTGYNFAHTLATTDIPDGDSFYLVQYLFTGATGGVSMVEFRIQSRENYFS